MKRLQQAKVAGQLEQTGQGPSFEIFDRPQEPEEPVFPNPKRVALASVALGGAAGAALIYLLAVLDTVVRDVSEARLILRMPVLGVMQSIVTAAQARARHRRRVRRIVGWGGGLTLVLIALAVGAMKYHEPLARKMETVARSLWGG
jgi:hypothetical protein